MMITNIKSMNPKTDVKITMAVLSAIVFVRPSPSPMINTMKVLAFHYLLGTLLFVFLWLMSGRWKKSVIVFSSFTIVKYPQR